MALGSMGQKSPYPMEDFDPYDDRTGVPFSREKALPFDELRRRFKAMQEPLATFVFHECYHVGQTGVLRRVAGKPGGEAAR